MRWIMVGLLTTAIGVAVLGQQSTTPKVTIVKYPELKNQVVDHRGNVVLVDFWSTSCLPCMKAFPHMVELHRKYASQGLTVISVNLDELTPGNRTAVVERVADFLDKQQAGFTNVILHETGEVLLEKLRLRSIPCVYLFDRNGKWRKFQDDEFDLAAVDKTVVKFLQQK